jgi:hypothetical protein
LSLKMTLVSTPIFTRIKKAFQATSMSSKSFSRSFPKAPQFPQASRRF